MKPDQSLINSAKGFLVEALDSYRCHKCSFAILHAVTAAELVLKERLARINPSLVYKNIDAPDFRGEHTVSLSKLPQRLRNFGVKLSSDETRLIFTFAEWRNQIVHHLPSFDMSMANKQLPLLLDFLAVFLRRELGIPLEKFLPKSLYRTAASMLRDWSRVVEAARVEARAEGSVLPDACPVCGATNVLTLRAEKRVFCHLCSAKHYHYDRCSSCGAQTVSQFSSLDEGNYCDECVQRAGDMYIDDLLEKERGK